MCAATCALFSSVSAQWVKQSVDTTASFRGLSVVNKKVVWASGTGGIVIRTIDGGKKWSVMTVPGAEKLDFRDIEAFDKFTAYILSIGNGESSRIYKTMDGGKSWKEQFRNTNEKAFFDAIACFDEHSCIAMSDPVDGKFLLISTSNGGEKWEVNTKLNAPDAITGEAAFAASGTCLITAPGFETYIVTGGNDARVLAGSYGRLFSSEGLGKYRWTSSQTPIVKGSAGSGIFSIARYGINNGVIVGGNYEKPNEINSNLAFTTDAGKTWKLGSGLSGFRSSVTYVDKKTIIAVGTNGSDITRDGGKTWTKFGDEELNAVAAEEDDKSVWAVGPKGGVYKLR